MAGIDPVYERKLYNIESREGSSLYIGGKKYLDFASNDYLGLADHEDLKAASLLSIQKYGTGSRAARLLSGNYQLYQELEEKLVSFKKKEAALVFNSGYQANLGLFSALFGKSDVIFSDKLNHASIVDGLRLSPAKVFRFNHNNIFHLETLIKKHRGSFKKALVIIESVFSMDGDIAPLKEIVELKKKYDLEIMIDEAHSTGIFGSNGSGMVEELGIVAEIDYIMGTFSKALGSFGAYFACSKEVKKYLINKCRSFIFTTALPPAVIAANIAAIDVVLKEKNRREDLLANSNYFRGELKRLGFDVLGESQIMPIVIGDAKKTVDISEALKSLGYWILPIRYPTVPMNKARLRISLSFSHQKKNLIELINDLSKQFI